MMKRPKRKNLLLAVLLLLGVLSVIGGSFGAYTRQTYQRGVVRNGDSSIVRFASNYLQSCAYKSDLTEIAYAGRTITFTEADQNETKLPIELYIYNYASGNKTMVSQKQITYDITIQFEGLEDYKDCSVTGPDNTTLTGNNGVYKIENQTLTSRSPKEHLYRITIPGSALNKVKIRVIAIPTNLSVTNNQMLAAVLAPSTGTKTETFQTEAKFIDEATGTNPTEYLGFNYEVSISSGIADATLRWDSSIIEIDKYFLEKIGKKEPEIAGILAAGSVSFEMDQSEESGDYLIPFYIVSKDNIPATWGEMKKLITFTVKRETTDQN